MKKIFFAVFLLSGTISGFTQQNNLLNQQEKDAILYMREEEKLARDVYNFLYDKWETNPFDNIRKSEQVHMDRMKTLITTYQLEDPVTKNNDKQGVFTNVLLQQYYNELSTSGSKSLIDALKAGAKIEELDIADLEERIKQTQRQDIVSSYDFLKMASENHLRAFVRRLKMQGVIYEPVILSKTGFEKIISSEGTPGRNGGKGWN
ncbi:MAG: DUF2202 domain-containing protein [Chitinophagaceae bacterium]|nr:DUF2202 domain-containing protein [Chitinophagaceae bacterium]